MDDKGVKSLKLSNINTAVKPDTDIPSGKTKIYENADSRSKNNIEKAKQPLQQRRQLQT